MKKLIRITTVPGSLRGLLKGQLNFMSENGFEVLAISSPDKELEEYGKIENVRTVPVEMTRKITLIKDLKAVFSLYKIFRKEKPDIVHTHTPKAGTVGMLAAYLARVPYRLHTIAGLPLLEIKGTKRMILNIVEKSTYVCATKIYPNSFVMKDIILENKFCKAKKLKVLANGSSNGINTSFFDPQLISEQKKNELRKSLGINNDDFVFIFVGRIVKDKGINELVAAFKNLSKKHNNIKLLLVGEYEQDLYPILLETEKEIKENPNIIETGFQQDVRPFFAISDILVFPSYREGFPNVVMQAGAMGLPSIVTDINGCNEIVENGVNGIIIPPKEENLLYKKMSILLENKDLRDKLHSNTRQMIVDRYEQRIVWDALLKEYNELEEKHNNV